MRSLCARVGTKKVFTTPYAPQTDGCVERFNATLCRDLAAFVVHETDWDKHVAFAVFRYNASRNSATGMTPFYAMFGVEAFEWDSCLGLALRLEEEPENVAERLAEAHAQLWKTSMKSRKAAQKQYDKAVVECQYSVGDRVMLYHPPGELEVGRKLRVPWLGPYRVVEKHSDCGYSIRSELGEKLARVHVNRLKKIPEGLLAEAGSPQQGLWPDVRREVRGILAKRGSGRRTEYKVRKAGRNGFVWTRKGDLPDVVVAAYEMSMKDRTE